jgi:hypothetical protein
MANKKISQLTDGTSFQAGDEAVVNRSGTNYKVDPTQFGSSIDVTGTVTADGLTSAGNVLVSQAASNSSITINRTDSLSQYNLTLSQSGLNAVITGNDAQAFQINVDPDNTQSGSNFILTIDGDVVFNADANGDISFYEDTGTTPKFFWDASAEALGIGTTSPYAKTVIALAPTVAATTVNETADFADQFVISNSGTSTNGDRLPLVFNLGGGTADSISAAVVGLRETIFGWRTALSFWTNNVTSGPEGTDAIQEKMRLDSDGNLLVGTTTSPSDTGTVVADGIYLGGTVAANLLDDYEEGTWTPAWAFAGGSATIGTINFATYTKVGQLVTVSFRAFTSSISSPTGQATITGLPFASADVESSGAIGVMIRFATDMPDIKCRVSGSSIQFEKAATNAGVNVYLDGSDFNSGAGQNIVSVCITYRTSA